MAEAASAPRARVVVVDDSRYSRELSREALEEVAEVECCESGQEALAALERASADLVLSDLTMPGLSGLELLARVQREHPGTDFVLITADASVESAVQALRKGATDYLQKPVRAEDLILVVERTMGRRRLLAENRRLRDECAILEACKSLSACLEPEEVYAVGLDLALGATRRELGIAVYHRASLPRSDGLQFRGFTEANEAALRQHLGGAKPLEGGEIRTPGRLDRGPLHAVLEASGVQAGEVLALPVQGGETERGVFYVLGDGRFFEDGDLARAAIVTGHTEIALRNAERYHRAHERAFRDDVTDLYNARYLQEAMEREIGRTERYGGELSVLFLDLDRFKLVNDRHGHLVGSDTLRQLARVLGECVRTVDTLARYGGDEFTIVLVDTDEQTALRVADRIRHTVAGHRFEAAGDEGLGITCSIGVATWPVHGETREAVLDAADKAMYRAKSNGRNRICSASDLA